MSKTINIIRKNKVKKALLEGKSGAKALLAGGFSEATARHHAHENVVLKSVIEEIEEEFKAEKITVEYVLKELERGKELALQKGDIASFIRANELLGKYLAMFTDKTQNQTSLSIEEVKRQEEALHKRFDLTTIGCG